MPDLIRRAAIVVLGTIAMVGVLALFLRSPLEEPAYPMVTPNPAKAPWYFLWLQEIVTDTTVHIGSFTINANGDPENASGAVVGFTIYKATDKLTTETTIAPKPETVTAAAGG